MFLLLKDVLYVALEYLPNGDLRSYLRKARPESDTAECLTSEKLVKFALDVAKGMEYLALSSVCHETLHLAFDCLLIALAGSHLGATHYNKLS